MKRAPTRWGSIVYTLPHLPYLVHRLVDDCTKAIASVNLERTMPLIITIRRKCLQSIEKRLSKHLNDPAQPSLIAASLMLEYSHRLHSEFGVEKDVMLAITKK